MTTTQPPADDATRVLRVVPLDGETQVIPAVPAAASIPAMDQTAVIPAVGSPVPVPSDATAVIPAVTPDKTAPENNAPQKTETPAPQRRPPRKDDTGFVLFGRVRAYDTDPGDPGYRGRHGDLIPLEEAAPVRRVLHTVGEVMITFGLVLLLFAAYEVWGKTAIVQSHQQDLDAQLQQEWNLDPTVSPAPSAGPDISPTQAAPAVPPGGTIGRLYLPRLNKYWVVVEGVAPQSIRYAPGHDPGTALPGEVGNVSVAGHRTPAIFWDLDQMRTDDAIVVETRTMYFVYHVTTTEIVKPTATQVVAPVPGHPGAAPTVAMLTLTTCNPKWDNYQRLIVHAALDWERSRPRSAGPPPEIGG
jgi:LPXTG-site transpeptidase (sortase) family protein